MVESQFPVSIESRITRRRERGECDLAWRVRMMLLKIS